MRTMRSKWLVISMVFAGLFQLMTVAVSSAVEPSEEGAVSLIIDYGNDAKKTFLTIPWPSDIDPLHRGQQLRGQQPIDLLTAIEAAAQIPPGLVYVFQEEESDRVGRDIGQITSIDGVDNDNSKGKWHCRINNQSVDKIAKATAISLGFEMGGGPQLNRGDTIYFTFVRNTAHNIDEFPQTITTETFYYLNGPQQARPPDGSFPKGTRVRLIEESGSYILVEASNGIKAFINRDAVEEK